MELQDFVSSSLIQIFAGIEKAQADTEGKGHICPVIRKDSLKEANTIPALSTEGHAIEFFEFDVAVTVDKSTESGGKLAISIGSIQIGGLGKKQAGQEALSRIKFRVPVVLPTKAADGH